jgi:hypothetical protein
MTEINPAPSQSEMVVGRVHPLIRGVQAARAGRDPTVPAGTGRAGCMDQEKSGQTQLFI